MGSTGNEGRLGDLPGDFLTSKDLQNDHEGNPETPLSMSTSKKALLGDSYPPCGLQCMKTTLPCKLRGLDFSSDGVLPSSSSRFQRIAEERDEISISVPSSTGQGLQPGHNSVSSRKINWASLWKTGKEWIKNPLNMAVFLWICCVAVSGGILFLVMTGMLNGALPKKSQRIAWFEANNQILNALFTLMVLYHHPKRIYHLVLLCRWRPKDITQLRSIYCKNGTYKPHEWTHMMVVIGLLHLNCLAQYSLCSLNLGYNRSQRPTIGVVVTLSVAIAAPAIAGLYTILSPLGREYDLEVDEESSQARILKVCASSRHVKLKPLVRGLSFASRNGQSNVENQPVWGGGIFDFGEDINLAYRSIFCSFCLFGWNMERLGFGNMYVHIATFILFCTAPFWIFTLAAFRIDDETVRAGMGITGIVLSLFGLLYGGFWRIQMRERFNLPGNNLCCRNPAVADCAQWLFCCWCSLAQEVRTADYYDIGEHKFCRKQMDGLESQMSSLPRENGLFQLISDPSSPSWYSHRLSKFDAEDSKGPSRFSRSNDNANSEFQEVVEDSYREGMDNSMKPPIPSIFQREHITNLETSREGN